MRAGELALGLVLALGAFVGVFFFLRSGPRSVPGQPPPPTKEEALAGHSPSHGKSEEPSSDAAEKDAAARKPRTRKATGPAAAQPDDHSLAVEEYVKLGMPSPTHSWLGQEISAAAKVFTALAEKDMRRLPRHESKRSGEVFARIISVDNLTFLRDKTLPLAARAPQVQQYMEALGQILKLYLTAYLADAVSTSEMFELQGMGLRAMVMAFQFMEEAIKASSPRDPAYNDRLQGLTLMKRGCAEAVEGCLIALSDRQEDDGEAVARLVGYLKETLPTLFPRLESKARKETLSRLAELVKKPEMEDVRPTLQELLDKLQRSARGR